MATNSEEILLRLGMDTSAMTKGTMAALDVQKKAAADYAGFWKKATAEREAAEVAADVRAASRANRAAALNRQRASQQASRTAAANAEIANGYVPENMASGGSSESAGGPSVKRLARIAKEGRSVYNDVASGNFIGAANGVGKLTGEITSLGSAALMAAGKFLGITAALAGVYEIGKAAVQAGQAADQSNASGAALKSQSGSLADKLGMAPGSTHEQIIRRQKELMAIQDKAAKDEAAAAAKLLETQKEKARVAKGMEEMQKHFNQLRQEEISLNKEANSIRKQYSGLQRGIDNIDKAVPTIGDLAGRDNISQLDRQFGAGGQFDIGDGKGPLAGAARDALFYEKKQMYDRTHGKYGEAELDRQKQIKAENQLSAAGIETPAMKEKAMRENMVELKENMKNLYGLAASKGIKIADAN